MMNQDFDLVGRYCGRMRVTHTLGIGQVADKVADGGKTKYFPVMNSVTNRDEGNERI